MKSIDALLIGAKLGEGFGVVMLDEPVGLFQRITPQAALHQSDCDHLSVREGRLAVVRATPMGECRAGLEEVSNKDVDFSHLVYNGGQGVVLLVQSVWLNSFTP